MKAYVQEQYGSYDRLKLKDVAKPVPKDGEVLVEVQAVSLNAPDWRLLRGKPFLARLSSGLFTPKNPIRGTDFSGIVVETGSGVSQFSLGDEVYGDLADHGFGAFAEYVAVKETIIAKKPKNLSHLEAASIPLTAVTGLQGIRDSGQLQRGDQVLILGASGGVGSFAIQIAKYLGGIVTAVTSKKNKDQSIALGADQAVAYNSSELSKLTGTYDLILAVNGYYPVKTYRKLLSPKGRFVLIGSSSMKELFYLVLFGGVLSQKDGQHFSALLAKAKSDDLAYAAALAEEGKLQVNLHKEIPFEKIPEGLQELEEGHVPGKIVSSTETLK